MMKTYMHVLNNLDLLISPAIVVLLGLVLLLSILLAAKSDENTGTLRIGNC
ncbi:MAG: hypothetical protein SOY83_06035 [Anaerovoracaceae bacterium]|nr:hypothetical protein [Anaerovoracaceae bacterium]